MLLVLLASFNNLANCRRPFHSTLQARSWIADVSDHFVWKALKDGSKRVLEAFSIRVLINSICGEQGELTLQDQRFPIFRAQRARGGLNP